MKELTFHFRPLRSTVLYRLLSNGTHDLFSFARFRRASETVDWKRRKKHRFQNQRDTIFNRPLENNTSGTIEEI